jgi:hydrogenase maturation protease
MHAEFLIQGDFSAKLEAKVRFLQLIERSIEKASQPTLQSASAADQFLPVKALTMEEKTFYSWQEAMERELNLSPANLETLTLTPLQHSFHLPASSSNEELRDSGGLLRGRIVRTNFAIETLVEVRGQQLSDQLFKVAITVTNITDNHDVAEPSREDTLMRSLVSTHMVLGIEGGDFVSLLEHPDSLQPAVADCHNQGWFPVLVGETGQRDTILVSPIILYDYPQIAPESAGDLFDGTEIDEILSLRIMTMTDEEKSEMRQSDDRARQMLERTENMPAEQFMKLHGALRGLRTLQEDSQ